MINPAVIRAAERFTVGEITDAILRDVAAMEGLPFYLREPGPPEPFRVAWERAQFAGACIQARGHDRIPRGWYAENPLVFYSLRRQRARKYWAAKGRFLGAKKDHADALR